MEKERPSGTCKGFRATKTYGRSIFGLYTLAVSCRSAVSIDMPCFFLKAPRCLLLIDSVLHVVSRKRLPDYVCPTTDGDADERTSGLYIVLPISLDLKLPTLLLLLFPCFFIVLFVSSDRPVCLPLSRPYIDRDATHQLTNVRSSV